MAFVRFIVPHLNEASGTPDGLISAAYDIERAETLDPTEREELQRQLRWIEQNVPLPDRFNNTSSKGYYRRNTKGISWFRDSAKECISRMYKLKAIAERHGHVVHVLVESRLGYIVHEDEVQVIAEPFASTKTNA